VLPYLRGLSISAECSCLQESQAALDAHIASEVSKDNVAFYEAGGLARPLSEMDIRIHTEYRR
jgi:hypothetical protein